MTMKYIIAKTAAVFGVECEDIRSRNKTKRIADAKRAAILVMHEKGYAWKAIGRELGIHHAAVMRHAQKAARIEDEQWLGMCQQVRV